MTTPNTEAPPSTDDNKETPEAELPADQEKALAALLTCRTIGAAAKKAGVGERTLHRWLNDPVFRQAYLAARRQVLSSHAYVIW